MIVTRRSICRMMISMCLSSMSTPCAVDLDFADQVALDRALAEDAQHVVRVGEHDGELLAQLDRVAYAHEQTGALRDRERRLACRCRRPG
ncbi:hypothetical protein SCALM49S_05203 [Streptomyces californicus]